MHGQHDGEALRLRECADLAVFVPFQAVLSAVKDDQRGLPLGTRAGSDHPVLARLQDLLIWQRDDTGPPFLN